MKLTCNILDLKAACVKAARMTNKNPVTDGLLLAACNGTLTVTGYDLLTGIAIDMPAVIEEQGSIVADAKVLSLAANKMQVDKTYLETDGDVLIIKNGRSKIKIKGISAEQYPALPNLDDGSTCTVNGDELSALIKRTTFCASYEKGVRLTMYDELSLCATDGFTLAQSKIGCKASLLEPRTAMIQPKALTELIGVDKDVDIGIGAKHFVAHTNKYTLFSRLMSSNWEINAETLIPKDCKKITIDFGELSAALERVDILAQSGLPPVKIESTENEMILSMKTATGSSMDSVRCRSEADIKLGVNAQYLARVLKAAAKVDSFFVSSPVSPIVFKDTESIYILLPVRLRGE